MADNSPKVSFIPKGSLIHEESFLERPRPRSVAAGLATFFFFGSAIAYTGLYFYDRSLVDETSKVAADLNESHKHLTQSPEIDKAKIFLERAALADEILNTHTVASPIFEFISQNTVSRIMYKSFMFKVEDGLFKLELVGEAPLYATLAYQSDVLRKRTKELTSFSIDNLTLTKFGTVGFVLKMTFEPKFLSYNTFMERSVSDVNAPAPIPMAPSPLSTQGNAPSSALPQSAGTDSMPSALSSITPDGGRALSALPGWSAAPAPAVNVSTTTNATSSQGSFWSFLKFW